MLNLFYYDFGVRLNAPDPNIYYRTSFHENVYRWLTGMGSIICISENRISLKRKKSPGAALPGGIFHAKKVLKIVDIYGRLLGAYNHAENFC